MTNVAVERLKVTMDLDHERRDDDGPKLRSVGRLSVRCVGAAVGTRVLMVGVDCCVRLMFSQLSAVRRSQRGWEYNASSEWSLGEGSWKSTRKRWEGRWRGL